MDSYKLLTDIISARVGYGYCCGTTDIFIINWQYHIQLYKTIAESSDHLSGVQKSTML